MFVLSSKVFTTPLDKLPSYTAEGDNSLCDICTKKGDSNQLATTYCVTCSKKLCSKHLEVKANTDWSYSCGAWVSLEDIFTELHNFISKPT